MDNTRANMFDLSIHKNYYINENTTSSTTSSTTPKPYSTTTTSTLPPVKYVKMVLNSKVDTSVKVKINGGERTVRIDRGFTLIDVEVGKSVIIEAARNAGVYTFDGFYSDEKFNNRINSENNSLTLFIGQTIVEFNVWLKYINIYDQITTITPDGTLPPVNTQPPINGTTSSTSPIPPNPTPDNTPDSKPDNDNKPNKPTLIITTSSTTSSTTPTLIISTTTSLKPYNNV